MWTHDSAVAVAEHTRGDRLAAKVFVACCAVREIHSLKTSQKFFLFIKSPPNTLGKLNDFGQT